MGVHTDGELGVERFLGLHRALASLAGVPAIYVHSLFATPGAHELAAQTGERRNVNRAHLDRSVVEAELDGDGAPARVFAGIVDLLRRRAAQPAFAPDAVQEVIELDERVLAVRRRWGDHELLALTNLSAAAITLSPPGFGPVSLGPYQAAWLEPE